MKTCHIYGALGLEKTVSVGEGDIVIAADAGYTFLKRLGIIPDMIVGDFDSLGEIPVGDNVIRHPIRKDETDTMLAVMLGFERGFRRFEIYGGLGGRTDHTIANIQTLHYIAEHGGEGFLNGPTETLTVIKNGSLSFTEDSRGSFSVFALGGTASGVTLENLSFELNDAVIEPSFPVGVSNEFVGKRARVSVKDGALLVIYGRNKAKAEEQA